MSTALTQYDVSQLSAVQLGDDADYNDSRGYLSPIVLYSKGKPIDKGFIKPGHFGIPNGQDEIIDLGESIDAIPFARKRMAVDKSDTNNIVRSYDPTSAEYQRIVAAAATDSMTYKHGPVFLIFERSTAQFYSLFLGSKSARPEGDKVATFLPLTADAIEAKRKAKGDGAVVGLEPHGPLAMTLKAGFRETPTLSWHVPVAYKCSVPFANAPDLETVRKQMTAFLTVASTTNTTETSKRAR